MRILHLNDYALPIGGAETYLAALIASQQKHGLDAALLATDSRGGGTLAVAPLDMEPFAWPLHWVRGTSSSTKLFRAARQLHNGNAAYCAEESLREFKPDIVHAHMYLGQLSPAVLEPFIKAQVPLIHTSHTYRIACPKGDRLLPSGENCRFRVGWVCAKHCSLAALAHMKLRESLHRAPQDVFKIVLAPGSAMAEVLKLEGFPDVRTLPYGSTFPISDGRQLVAEPRVLYVGRISESKGVFVLLEAFETVRKAVPNAELLYVGDGPAKRALMEQADRAFPPGACRFHGFAGADEILSFQDGSRVQVIPSLWPDNSPLVVYESLSRGIPVVASRTGGIPDLVQPEKEGILVAPGDGEALSDAIIRLLTDDALCERVSSAQLDRARSLTMDNHVSQLNQIYQEVLGQ